MKNMANDNRGIARPSRPQSVEILSTTPDLLSPTKGSWAKSRMTPEEASRLYIELEKLYDEITVESKYVRTRRVKDMLAKRKKSIRMQQNLLYPIMAGTGWVVRTQVELGFFDAKQSEILYKRYNRMKQKQEKSRKGVEALKERVLGKQKEQGE